MAIEKTLNTRILNKIDTLENWNGSSLKIKQGEICIAAVAASAGTGLAEPVCMIKIGTAEEKTFSELPWSFYAKASDVLTACKSEAGLKEFINGVIADSGLATDGALTALSDRVATAEGEIDDLQGLVGDTAVATQISTAVATEKTRAEGVEAGLETRLAAVEGDYLKAADKTALQEQIDANESAIELLTNGVSSEEVDGVNDLIQYVKDHGTEVTGMKTDISNNTKAINDEKTRAEGVEGELDTRLQVVEAAVGETGSVATAIEEAVAEAKGYTDAEIQELADGAVKTNTTNIAELQGLVGDTAVTTQVSDAINTLKDGQLTTMQGEIDAVEDRATALEAKSHEHANKTVLDGIEAADITAWDGKVDDITAVAESGLKATRTGNTVAIEIDDSVTFIFDCGDSTDIGIVAAEQASF